MSDSPTQTRRTAGAPPAYLWSVTPSRSATQRWHVHVYNPALSMPQRVILVRYWKGGPLPFALSFLAATMAAFTGWVAVGGGAPTSITIALAVMSLAFFAFAAAAGSVGWSKRRPAAAVKKEFRAAHPGQRLRRYGELLEGQGRAIAAVEAAVKALSVTGPTTGALHQALWDAVTESFRPLTVDALIELTPARSEIGR